MTNAIYLDGFATLPLAPEAREAMIAAWTNPGNAGSANLAGEVAARTIAVGRHSVANLIGASPAEITFTSGATEANNLAILGAARRDEPNRNRVIVSAVVVMSSKHRAVADGPGGDARRRGRPVSER